MPRKDKLNSLRSKCFAFAIAAFTTGSTYCAHTVQAQAVDQFVEPQGQQILTRGPMHEAFAETVTFNPTPGIVVQKAPGAIIEEMPPEQRPEGADVTWIPGYWGWDDERNDFIWISGTWRDLPPGRQWVPGYWSQSGAGYQWTSGHWADAGLSETEYLPEPPESIETGPSSAAPRANQDWIPGSWVWQQNRYSWRPGYWAAGRADWVWVPAHYIWAPRGYIFSDGYWDHAMERRGVLFAPVYFEQQVYSRPSFSYSPTIAINLSVITDQLFVRPRYHHYYFGDYYDNRYRDTGFFASFSFQSERHGYEPFYSHRRWQHRADRDWERRDRDAFAHRRDNRDDRPPHTFRDQNDRDRRAPKPGENRRNVATRYDRLSNSNSTPVRFQKVDKTEREQLGRRAQGIQNTRRQRQELELKQAPRAATPTPRIPEATKQRLPRPVVVGKSIPQNANGHPPIRQKFPGTDPKVAPRTRPIVQDSGDKRSPQRKGADATPTEKRDSNDKKPPPNREMRPVKPSSGSNRGEKEQPKEDKKPKKD